MRPRFLFFGVCSAVIALCRVWVVQGVGKWGRLGCVDLGFSSCVFGGRAGD